MTPKSEIEREMDELLRLISAQCVDDVENVTDPKTGFTRQIRIPKRWVVERRESDDGV